MIGSYPLLGLHLCGSRVLVNTALATAALCPPLEYKEVIATLGLGTGLSCMVALLLTTQLAPSCHLGPD